jgi:hypothetical protein
VNHYGTGSSISIDDWKTPLGTIKTDKSFAKEISEKTGLIINEEFHEKEHSIEVQLPMLQYASKERLQELQIVCITLADDFNLKTLAKDMKLFLEKQDKKVTIIISSDFTHYGRSYGYLPFSTDVKKRIDALDKKAIDFIMSKDADGFLSYVDKTGDTICGALPISLLLLLLEKEEGNLLMYYQSSEISNDTSNSVSYASIMFK